jgi:hypothetical protein
MPCPELIPVTGYPQNSQQAIVEIGKPFFALNGNGNPLTCNSPTILQACNPHILRFDSQAEANFASEFFSGKIAFFNPKVKKSTSTTRLIGRYLLNKEVIGNGFDPSAQTWDITQDAADLVR